MEILSNIFYGMIFVSDGLGFFSFVPFGKSYFGMYFTCGFPCVAWHFF